MDFNKQGPRFPLLIKGVIEEEKKKKREKNKLLLRASIQPGKSRLQIQCSGTQLFLSTLFLLPHHSPTQEEQVEPSGSAEDAVLLGRPLRPFFFGRKKEKKKRIPKKGSLAPNSIQPKSSS